MDVRYCDKLMFFVFSRHRPLLLIRFLATFEALTMNIRIRKGRHVRHARHVLRGRGSAYNKLDELQGMKPSSGDMTMDNKFKAT